MDNILVRQYAVKKGNCLMYYPEANRLLSRAVDPRARTPAFKNTPIKVTPL